MTRPGDDPNTALLDQLVEQLMASAEHPPSQVDGVSDEFLEQLERVPKKNLKSEQSCPICSNPFLEGTSMRPNHNTIGLSSVPIASKRALTCKPSIRPTSVSRAPIVS
jgi:hypothetical protein